MADTSVWGPLGWALEFEFARIIQKVLSCSTTADAMRVNGDQADEDNRRLWNATMIAFSYIFPCKYCRESYALWIICNDPRQAVDPLLWIWETKAHVNKKLHCAAGTLPFSKFRKRAETWTTFVSVEQLWDFLSILAANFPEEENGGNETVIGDVFTTSDVFRLVTELSSAHATNLEMSPNCIELHKGICDNCTLRGTNKTSSSTSINASAKVGSLTYSKKSWITIRRGAIVILLSAMSVLLPKSHLSFVPFARSVTPNLLGASDLSSRASFIQWVSKQRNHYNVQVYGVAEGDQPNSGQTCTPESISTRFSVHSTKDDSNSSILSPRPQMIFIVDGDGVRPVQFQAPTNNLTSKMGYTCPNPQLFLSS